MRRVPKNTSSEAWHIPNSLKPKIGLEFDGMKPARRAKIQEAARREKQIRLSVEAGQLAVGQYNTPHTRQAAETAARTVQAALIGQAATLPETFIEGLHEVTLLNVREELGQYYQPHAKQAAEVASTEMLKQNGYLNQEQGEK